jgi:NAD(P)-dependent dehydrogenase (short-subunit alcohol dehydrogenase family)
MAGRTIVITGASDGLGAAAAERLTRSGENVVVIGRSPSKTEAVATPLGADYFIADFADLTQVRELANQLLARYPRIDVLANNAGGMMSAQRVTTVDGHELTFQVNHLAPFLLTTLLLDRLIETRATVINTSSVGNRFGHIDITDLDHERKYQAQQAYGSAKLANILFTKELHRRYQGAGISTAAFHPGPVASNFGSESGRVMRLVYHSPLKNVALIGPEKGSDQLVWLASTTPGAGWTPGEYYANYRRGWMNKQAGDAALSEQLWDRSLDMIAAPVQSKESS